MAFGEGPLPYVSDDVRITSISVVVGAEASTVSTVSPVVVCHFVKTDP
jgi:hypothetical protein